MVDVLERGAILFLYRPKVDTERVRGLDDVQGVFLVLEPEGGGPVRRVELGRKSLPPQGWAGRRHGWAFVAEVERDPQRLDVSDAPEGYETKTRGHRVQPEDRPLGEGTYELVRHGEHVHLAYVLTEPAEPGPAQTDTNLEGARSLHVKVKDPTNQDPQRQRTPTSGRTEPLPAELQERFAGRRFVACDPPAFLDHEGVELLLMPAGEDDDPGEWPDAEEHPDVLDDLGLDAERLPTDPLERGEWA